MRDLLKNGEEGRFFRGNLHCHSNRSDGKISPEAVACVYRDAGYDFICLSDHSSTQTENAPGATRSGPDRPWETPITEQPSSGSNH